MKRTALWILIVAVATLVPQFVSADKTVEIKKVPLDRYHLSLQTGAELYQGFCAVCHGVTGRGDGPAAEALDVVPSDLTTLASENDGEFPSLTVLHTISGRYQEDSYHTVMPAWEEVFLAASDNRVGARLRVRNLTLYVAQIQRSGSVDD